MTAKGPEFMVYLQYLPTAHVHLLTLPALSRSDLLYSDREHFLTVTIIAISTKRIEYQLGGMMHTYLFQ